FDGTKVAYVETSASGAVLHIVKWKAGEGVGAGDAALPDQTLAAAANWSTCTAGNSCIANLTFNAGAEAQHAHSSPYYDFNNDAMYIGDNNGVLHKFSGVFSGAPQEVTTGGWPITVHAGTILSSPVHDAFSSNIFVGDASGRLSYARDTG